MADMFDEAFFKTTILKLFPTDIYLFKVNNRNTRKRCDMFKVSN